MTNTFLLYGSTGYVGDAIARLAVQCELQPVLAGRNAEKLKAQAAELGLSYRVFDLDHNSAALDQALKEVPVVLHCAGPYLYTFKPMLEGCLRTGAHYLDLTGELPVYQEIAARDAVAKARGVMLLPGVGFDVVPTDCLALHLKQRLPSATHLALAFQGQGPAGLPPGTQRTAIEMVPFGNWVRRNGRLETSEPGVKTRLVDFGSGPVQATRMTWGDIFTAYYSTGIPNIEDYLVLPEATRRQMAMMFNMSSLFKLPAVRNFLKRAVVKPGPTAEERARTVTQVWGEVQDDQGQTAVSRLTGPEAGVIWTGEAALAAVRKVLAGSFTPGFQTPARAYGADFVLECEGVSRIDL